MKYSQKVLAEIKQQLSDKKIKSEDFYNLAKKIEEIFEEILKEFFLTNFINLLNI